MKTKQHFVLRKDGQIVGGVRSLKEGADMASYRAQREEQGFTVQTVSKPPTVATMTRWMCDGVAKSITGQRVEPDHPESWIRVLGFI